MRYKRHSWRHLGVYIFGRNATFVRFPFMLGLGITLALVLATTIIAWWWSLDATPTALFLAGVLVGLVLFSLTEEHVHAAAYGGPVTLEGVICDTPFFVHEWCDFKRGRHLYHLISFPLRLESGETAGRPWYVQAYVNVEPSVVPSLTVGTSVRVKGSPSLWYSDRLGGFVVTLRDGWSQPPSADTVPGAMPCIPAGTVTVAAS